ncbi:hypothetical protein ABIF68_002856 [Bradyrhizobium japonicum]
MRLCPPYESALRVLRIESKMHHVAVGDDVFLAFETQLAGIAGTGFAVQRDIVLIRNRLSARMKPFSKSVWITPAAPGALVPR